MGKRMLSFVLLCWSLIGIAFASTYAEACDYDYCLSLKRVVILDDSGVQDSYLQDMSVSGEMKVDTYDDFSISDVYLTAEVDGDTLANYQNSWVQYYEGNGARYAFFDDARGFWSVQFLRRAPLNDSFDPATILVLESEDGATFILDYRYSEDTP
jgi:hypothetical protein